MKIGTMEWTEAIRVGNNKLDDQHKRLFEITNTLIGNANADDNSEIVSTTLYELIKYTKTHFKDEEAYLESVFYPHLDAHKKKHFDFLYEVAMASNNVVEGTGNVTHHLIIFLRDWLLDHTTVDDQDYKKYM